MLGIFAVTLPGFLVGALFMAASRRRAPPGAMRERWLKLGVFFVIVHVVLGVAIAGTPWITALLAMIVAAGALELRGAWRRMAAPRPRAVWPVYAFAAAAVLAVSARIPGDTFAFLFLVTAAADGFAQVTGQLYGRHRLAPVVSPAKTVEGLAGGLVAAVVVALLVRGTLLQASIVTTALLACATALAGLLGDLAGSWVKRRAGLKDFSAALPGQGGFLDRFDSLLGATALVGTLLLLGSPGPGTH